MKQKCVPCRYLLSGAVSRKIGVVRTHTGVEEMLSELHMSYEYRGFPPPKRGVLLLPFEPDASAARAWLSELPMASIDRSAQMMLRALQALNAHPLPARKRLEFAELCRHFACYFSKALENHFLDAEFPLDAVASGHLETSVWLHAELFNAYRLIMDDGEFGKTGEFDSEESAKVLHRAFYSAAQMLLRFSQAYEPPFPDFWHSVYKCRFLAERYDLLGEVVSDSESDSTGPSSLETMVKRILVFHVCDTCRFRQREIGQLFEIAVEYAEYALLETSPPVSGDRAVFGVDLRSDQPPRNVSLFSPQKDMKGLYLFTRPVADRIHARHFVASQGTGGKFNALRRGMLRRVIKALAMPARRRYSRVPESTERTVVVGFRNLVTALARATRQPPAQMETRIGRHLDPRIAGQWDVPELELVPMDNDFGNPFLASAGVPEFTSAATTSDPARNGRCKQAEDSGVWNRLHDNAILLSEEAISDIGEVIDSSAGGYCVAWRSDKPRIKIGDVAGLPVEENRRTEIGIIRRLARSRGGDLVFGVELLAPQAELVTLSMPGHEAHRVRAIFLAGVKACDQSDSVLLPPSAFEVGEWVLLEKDGREALCRLHRLVQATAAFNRMTVTYAER